MVSTAPNAGSGGSSGNNVPSSSSIMAGDTAITTTTTATAATTTTTAQQGAFQQQQHQQATNNSFVATASGGLSSDIVSGVDVRGGGGMMKVLPTTENSNTTTNNNPTANNKESSNSNNNNNSSKRLSKTTAYLPFVYGSIAFYLGKKADEFQTHEWTLYVRGPNQEDLSLAISKVVFQLHASFAKPIRELTSPPFEVTERGWGEFEAQIRIIWKDPEEKPTVVNHLIKLYPPGAPQNVVIQNNGSDNGQLQKPVIAEKYDEAVFTDPNESFYRSLGQISVVPKVDFVHWKHVQTTNYDDNEDFLKLLEASKFLQSELTKVKERYKDVSNDLSLVDQALIKVSQQQQQQKQAQQAARTAAATQSSSKSSSSRQASRSGGGGGGGDGTGTTTTGGGGSKKSKSSTSQRKRPSQAKKAKLEK